MARTVRLLALLALLPLVAVQTAFAAPPVTGLLAGSLYQRAARTVANWTVMVYVDGDNNLEPYAIADLNEMEAVGSTASVNLLVQMDRSTGYDTSNGNWTECRRYRVTKDSDTATIGSPVVQSLGEVNMGDGATLAGFLDWGMTNYPASKYALVLWDHGGGWRSPGRGLRGQRAPRRATGAKAVCWDDGNGGDCLYTKEWATVLGAAPASLALLGFDTCLAGMIEPAYEARVTGGAAAMVASAALEPGEGWPYDTVCAALTANPALDGVGLGDVVVDCYGEYYAAETMACYDLTCTPAVLSAVNSFAAAADSQAVWATLAAARAGAQTYDTAYLDLPGFVQTVREAAPVGAVRAAATTLATALASFVHSYVSGTSYSDGRGLAVSFPADGPEAEYTGANLAWVGAAAWDEFLRAYGAADTVPPTAPVLAAIDNTDGDGTYTLNWGAATDNVGVIRYEVQECVGPTVLLGETAEAGTAQWNLDGFATSNVQAHGGSYSFYSGQGNDLNSSLTLAAPRTLPAQACLSFWAWYDTEQGYDFASVWLSADGGSSWRLLRRYSGASPGWVSVVVDLSAYAGQSVLLRFSYVTDYMVSQTGFYVDDLELLDCTPTASSWVVDGSTLSLAVTGRPAGRWGYRVRAADAGGNAADSLYRSVTVSAGAPAAPTSVAITPARPGSADDLVATAAGSEGAAARTKGLTYAYEWCRRSGSEGAWSGWDYAGATVSADLTTRGEQWKARARAASGGLYSAWVESAPVTVGNGLPSAPAAVTVTPQSPRTGATVIARATGYDDPDGDTVTCQYQWCRSTDEGETWSGWDWAGRTLGAEETARGERWQVRARARDGSGAGPWATSEVIVIRNTAPTAPTAVAVKPAAPARLQNLTAAAGGSTDADAEALRYVYEWSRSLDGGATWSKWGHPGKVLPAQYTGAEQQWRVRARASDGSLASPWRLSTPVVVRAGTAPALVFTMAPAPGAHPAAAVQATCVLTRAATVQGRLLSLAGRTAALLAPRALPAGSTLASWPARSPGGLALPSGSYLLELQACTAGGESLLTRTMVTLRR